MYDIIKDIWKNPGAMFSPFPMWFWNDELDREELLRQLDDFHKKGIDGFIIHPRKGMTNPGYLSDEYFSLVEAVLEAAKKRFMQVILYDEGMYPSGSAHGMVVNEDARFAARRLYALQETEKIPENEELQFKVFLRYEGDRVADIRFEKTDGYEGYNLVLGYTNGTIRGLCDGEDDGEENAPKAADILNPSAVDTFLKLTHDRYYEKLSPYFGNTVIGFFTDEPSVTGRCADMKGGISWTYGMIEDFMENGGDFSNLVALLFDTSDNRLRKESEYIYRQTLRSRLGRSYYVKLSDWCRKHGVALTGHPSASDDCETMKYFDIPGQDLVWRKVTEETCLTAADSVLAKCAADSARHLGISRNSCECFGACGDKDNPWKFSPDEMMWYLNFLFARGCNLIIPHAFYYSVRTGTQTDDRPPDVGPNNIWWNDYRRISGYIKRMSWLNSVGTNNPVCAVLCSSEYMPVTPVKPLFENGYTFNYLSVDDLMNRAHIHDGKIRIDRYSYDTLLIDGRLRLNADIVKKIGLFITEGGNSFRGSDFIGYLSKHVNLTTYFDGDTHKNLRFTHFSKSGCPFFLMVNEGNETISGSLVTSQAGRASVFDPFTGGSEEISCDITDRGFEYRVVLGAHEVRVIGMDPEKLPLSDGFGSENLKEIVSLSGERNTFDFMPQIGRHAVLSFTDIDEMADISVNGKYAGRIIFKPYELDITDFLHSGENTVEMTVIESIANKYGTKVTGKACGCTVRIYDTDRWKRIQKKEDGEIWDIYDVDRNPVGRTQKRGSKIEPGDYHMVVHIWVRNKKGEILLTKRSPDKMYPLAWECTGGSALAGEDSLTAALREVREETGIKLRPENGKVLFTKYGEDYFGDVWLFDEEFDTSLVRLQKGETVDCMAASKDKVNALVLNGEMAPYDYYEELMQLL